RRRVARIIEGCVDPRAMESLMRGLESERFDVRYVCARALSGRAGRHGGGAVDRDRVLQAVLRETRLDRRVWQSQHVLDRLPEDREAAHGDAVLRDRAGRSMELVFVLLDLVLPGDPLRLAYRGLLTGDPILRGTALEYL